MWRVGARQEMKAIHVLICYRDSDPGELEESQGKYCSDLCDVDITEDVRDFSRS